MTAKTLLAGAAAVALSACIDVSGPGGFTCRTDAPVIAQTRGDTAVTTIGLSYVDTRTGTGDPSRACATVQIHYRAFVRGETTPFDSTATGNPLAFVAGGGQLVVPGLDVGVIGMRKGGERRLFIPPELGFGGQQVVYKGKTIPGNTPLVFDVVLVDFEDQE